MVDVRMREPDADGFRAGGGELVDDEPGFSTGFDHHTRPAWLVDDEIAVLGEQPVRDRDNSHDATPAFSFSRVAARYFSTAIAAVVASPTAVVIWRVSWLRTSPAANSPRSEEHTSELQSRLHLVCRLLLEKKKKNREVIMS